MPGRRAAGRRRPAGIRHGRRARAARDGRPAGPGQLGQLPDGAVGRPDPSRAGSPSRARSTSCRSRCRPTRSTASCYDRPWTVTGPTTTIAIDLDGRWPFRGRVTQRFALRRGRPGGLDDARGGRAAAGRAGLAPVVPARPRRRRGAGAPRVRAGLHARPRRRGHPDRRARRRRRRALGRRFTDLAADPVLEWPGQLRLAISSTCRWWVVYSMPEHAICVEPQSGPPDARQRALDAVDGARGRGDPGRGR